MANLQGGDALKARLKAIQLMFKPYGKKWADTAVDLGRPKLPTRPASMRAGDGHAPGRLAGSIKRKSATQRKANVAAHYTAYFIDKGVKEHSMSKRIKGESAIARGERTRFHKKHPGYKPRPFRHYITMESNRRNPMALTLKEEWNNARTGRY